jgi:hypothetical protein
MRDILVAAIPTTVFWEPAKRRKRRSKSLLEKKLKKVKTQDFTHHLKNPSICNTKDTINAGATYYGVQHFNPRSTRKSKSLLIYKNDWL